MKWAQTTNNCSIPDNHITQCREWGRGILEHASDLVTMCYDNFWMPSGDGESGRGR